MPIYHLSHKLHSKNTSSRYYLSLWKWHFPTTAMKFVSGSKIFSSCLQNWKISWRMKQKSHLRNSHQLWLITSIPINYLIYSSKIKMVYLCFLSQDYFLCSLNYRNFGVPLIVLSLSATSWFSIIEILFFARAENKFVNFQNLLSNPFSEI